MAPAGGRSVFGGVGGGVGRGRAHHEQKKKQGARAVGRRGSFFAGLRGYGGRSQPAEPALYASPQLCMASRMGLRLRPRSVRVYSTRGGTSG